MSTVADIAHISAVNGRKLFGVFKRGTHDFVACHNTIIVRRYENPVECLIISCALERWQDRSFSGKQRRCELGVEF